MVPSSEPVQTALEPHQTISLMSVSAWQWPTSRTDCSEVSSVMMSVNVVAPQGHPTSSDAWFETTLSSSQTSESGSEDDSSSSMTAAAPGPTKGLAPRGRSEKNGSSFPAGTSSSSSAWRALRIRRRSRQAEQSRLHASAPRLLAPASSSLTSRAASTAAHTASPGACRCSNALHRCMYAARRCATLLNGACATAVELAMVDEYMEKQAFCV
mmetsp:Transcript_16233/g.39268  ORF Transcript_16233/g.39268 Transcript_16233/m.39268 type:complete len:212 (+) Transcript_16233:310-945(+)